jgi:4-O-beta-D-mannosyl-D-glucose phosphorylase
MHVATTTLDKLTDYVMNTPEDAGRTQLCAAQRDEMVKNNLKIIAQKYPDIKI